MVDSAAQSSVVEDFGAVWHDTLENEEIPVQTFRETVREKPKDKLKNEKFDCDEIIKSNITKKLTKYRNLAIVYHA